jgi:hypothetical protein
MTPDAAPKFVEAKPKPFEIPVDQLTDEEIALLEARGGISGPVVSVVTPERTVPLPAPGQVTRSVVDAPAPAADVVARAAERIKAQQALEGASFEARDEKGNVVLKAGELEKPAEPEKPKEDPIETVDRANFLAHILGAPHFVKAYELFGGALIVEFKTRTTEEDEKCSRQSFFDEEIDGYFGTTGSETRNGMRLQRYYDYQFVSSLHTIRVKGQPPRVISVETGARLDPSDHSKSALRTARISLTKELPQPLRIALRDVHNKFETLVFRLVRAAESPDFWTAASAT